MKKFSLCLIVFLIWSNSFGQICDSLSSWNYLQVMIPTCLKSTECSGKYYSNHHYFFHGDSLINKTIYKVLYDNPLNNGVQNGNKLGFLREDEIQKKVYFLSIRDASTNSEILLYDFSIKKDSIFKISDFSSKVISLDSLDYFGKKRLVIRFSYTIYNFASDKDDTLKWIEGIGSNMDLLYYYNYPNYLLCFNSSDGLQYKNESDFDCEYRGPVQSVEKISNLSLRIYPNPTKDELNIEKDTEIKRIEIIDVYGKRLFICYPNLSFYKINNLNLKEGIYLLKIDNENRKIIIK